LSLSWTIGENPTNSMDNLAILKILFFQTDPDIRV